MPIDLSKVEAAVDGLAEKALSFIKGHPALDAEAQALASDGVNAVAADAKAAVADVAAAAEKIAPAPLAAVLGPIADDVVALIDGKVDDIKKKAADDVNGLLDLKAQLAPTT